VSKMRLVLLASVSVALLAVAEAQNDPPPPPPPPPPPCDGVTCTHGSCSNLDSGYTCCGDGHCGNGASCTAHTGACSNVCLHGGTHDPATGACTCAAGYQGQTCADKKSCTSPSLPPHSAWGSGGCSNKHYHDTCTATCEDGWKGGTISASFECEDDGHFSGSLDCTGAPPLAPPARNQLPCPLPAATSPPAACCGSYTLPCR
jgi:hypothetical protein